MLPLASLIRGIGAFKQRLPQAEDALPGRAEPLPLHNVHFVHGQPLRGEFAGMATIDLGLGCFWGPSAASGSCPGWSPPRLATRGITPNPTYEESCTGLTGHTEVVRVVFDPAQLGLDSVLRTFWESHDPTQGMRQGNDVGTCYRSAIYCHTPQQHAAALASAAAYQQQLDAAGFGTITTEIRYPAPPFYYAEDYHQQYLAKNPGGYCGLGGTGVSCPLGLGLDG